MQQNVVLAALKIIVMTAFAIFLGLDLFATQNLEEKMMRTRERVDGLAEGISETNRRIDKVGAAADKATSASERSYERLDALLDAIERGGIPTGGGNGGTRAGGATTKRDPIKRTGKPSVISGVEVWPRNPGWTVLCDSGANVDPKAEIPEDKVDWNATYPVALAGEPKGLNWYNDDRTVTVVEIARYVADFLAERKVTNPQEWKARLAERIEESPDKKTFMIYLRKGVFWHRPALDMQEFPWLDKDFEVTSADVKYTIDMILAPASSSAQKPYWDKMESCEVLDKYTLRITWTVADFLARQTVLETRPLPRHIWAFDKSGKEYDADNMVPAFNNHWFSKNMCGNGPYRFAEYKPGDSMRCERNENYYAERATCKEILYKIVNDAEQRLARFWNGEAISASLSAEQYRRVILDGEAPSKIYKYEDFTKRAPKAWDFTYFIWRRPVYGGFSWNMRRDVLNERGVRKALTHALNRQAVVDKLFYGLGELLAVGQSKFSPYYPKHLVPEKFDLDRARELLKEAGWKDTDGDGILDKVINGKKKDLEFELVISSSSSLQTSIAQMYKDDLLKCGVRLKDLPVDAALWGQKNSRRDYDGLVIFWFADYDSDPRQLWASEYADQPGSNNYSGYKNAEADEIFKELTTTFDYPTRIELYRKWYDMQFRDAPYTWIWSVHSPILVSTKWRVPEPKLAPPYVDKRLVFRWKD